MKNYKMAPAIWATPMFIAYFRLLLIKQVKKNIEGNVGNLGTVLA